MHHLSQKSCVWHAAQALGTGIMNKDKADQLAEMRDKMGLSKEAAEKIIKGVQNQHLIGNLQVGILHSSLAIDMLEALAPVRMV